ncbi:MAG: peptide deformylase [Phycisphaerae bacterium]|nr:peptide deformylase [Phycisphaerae bacterium]
MQPNTIKSRHLQIVHYPNPLLKKIAQPITEITSDIVELAERMTFMMEESNGIGLAAPQVGISLRLVVISITGKQEDARILINPVLSDLQGVSESEEGCLSLPGVYGNVKRAASCSVTAQDIDGNSFMLDAVDLAATVAQHEVDHLDGKLFIDRLSTLQHIKCRRSIKQLEKEY